MNKLGGKGHPRCYECGNRLQYVDGTPRFATVTVDGVEFRVHKDCKRHTKYKDELAAETAKADVRVALQSDPIAAARRMR